MTNKTISITCDSDNFVALNAFSKALAEMAQAVRNARELHVGVSVNGEDVRRVLEEEIGKHISITPITEAITTSPLPSATEIAQNDTYPVTEWVEMIHPDHNTTRMARSDAELEWMISEGWVYPDASDGTDTPLLDSEGLPWDARIHSTNKATVADGTWRLRRKPKELDEVQWQAEIKTVRNELEQLMAIELEDDTPEPAAVFAPAPPPVVESHVDVPPPPVETVTVAPPVIVPPPPVANVEPMTFPKLMTFLTERTGRITLEQVNELVAKHGLTRIDQLSQRPELIAAFVADVKTLLGE